MDGLMQLVDQASLETDTAQAPVLVSSPAGTPSNKRQKKVLALAGTPSKVKIHHADKSQKVVHKAVLTTELEIVRLSVQARYSEVLNAGLFLCADPSRISSDKLVHPFPEMEKTLGASGPHKLGRLQLPNALFGLVSEERPFRNNTDSGLDVEAYRLVSKADVWVIACINATEKCRIVQGCELQDGQNTYQCSGKPHAVR